MRLGWAVGSFFLLLSAVLIQSSLAQHGDGTKGSERGKEREPDYYGIYSAIDTMTRLTKHRTFYELLGVEPDASSDVISRAFRKTSLAHHPDKLRQQGIVPDAQSQQLSQLVQFVGSLFRSERGRQDYDWVLNEAPAWHRQSVYMMRRLSPTSKLTLRQVLFIVLVFSLGLQLAAHWMGYLASWYMILSSRWALREMGEKEVKRLRKRMLGTDPTFLAMSSTAYHTIMNADRPPPPLPNPLRLWIFALPIRLFKAVLPGKRKQA